MNNKVRRLCICNLSALLAGALPNAALAHPPVARTADLHALLKVSQLTARKNIVFLFTHRAAAKSALLASQRTIAKSDQQLQQQINEINALINARNQSRKSRISLYHTNARLLLTQLRLTRRSERLTQLHTILESAK